MEALILIILVVWLLAVVVVGGIENLIDDKEDTKQTYYTKYNYNQKEWY